MVSAATTETAFGGTYFLDGVWKYAINRKPVKNAVTLKLGAGGVTILAAELLPDRLLTMKGIAEYVGVEYESIRTYRAKKLLPEPVMVIDQTPLWTKPVIRAWNENRPGQGGGVRPNRVSNSPLNVWRRSRSAQNA
jgi:hypothetical protein